MGFRRAGYAFHSDPLCHEPKPRSRSFAMHDTIPLLRVTAFPRLPRRGLTTFLVNLDYPCNPRCVPVHVNASPQRTGGVTP